MNGILGVPTRLVLPGAMSSYNILLWLCGPNFLTLVYRWINCLGITKMSMGSSKGSSNGISFVCLRLCSFVSAQSLWESVFDIPHHQSIPHQSIPLLDSSLLRYVNTILQHTILQHTILQHFILQHTLILQHCSGVFNSSLTISGCYPSISSK